MKGWTLCQKETLPVQALTFSSLVLIKALNRSTITYYSMLQVAHIFSPQATQNLLSATGLGIDFTTSVYGALVSPSSPLTFFSLSSGLGTAFLEIKASILLIVFSSRNPTKITATSLGTNLSFSIYGALGQLHALITFFPSISPLHCYTIFQ